MLVVNSHSGAELVCPEWCSSRQEAAVFAAAVVACGQGNVRVVGHGLDWDWFVLERADQERQHFAVRFDR